MYNFKQMPVFKLCNNFSEVNKDMPAMELNENSNKALQGTQREDLKVKSQDRGSDYILNLKCHGWERLYHAKLLYVVCLGK